MMDWQALFNIVLGLLVFISGGLSTIIWSTLQKLRDDMTKLSESVNSNQAHATETYMRRDDFSAALTDLKATMNRGFDQLAAQINGKQDKP